MLIKFIKCLLITILVFVAIFILATIIQILKTMIGAVALTTVCFCIVVFGAVFMLVWTTLY